MEKLLGILFCGGRGTRLGAITDYISKSFVPINDKPVFMFGLELLEKSKFIDGIVILTNKDNDSKLKKTGYRTIIQDDSKVNDMLTGFQFVKRKTKTRKNCVLMPSDNITDIYLDKLITNFYKNKADFAFSAYNKISNFKMKEMGVFDTRRKEYTYKPKSVNKYMSGVIAPFIIANKTTLSDQNKIFQDLHYVYSNHNGYWFDIGDYKSIIQANKYFINIKL